MFIIKLLWLPVTIALSLLSVVSRIAIGLFSFAIGHLIVLGVIVGGLYLLTR